jgi:hypothetical protein
MDRSGELGRSRTRALATRVWARRSSVDHRIAMIGGAIPTTGRRSIHPAWESISRRSPARVAALRVDLARGTHWVWPTSHLHCNGVLGLSTRFSG